MLFGCTSSKTLTKDVRSENLHADKLYLTMGGEKAAPQKHCQLVVESSNTYYLLLSAY